MVFLLKDKIVPFHSMKAYSGTISIVTLILDLDPGWNACLDRFTQLNVRMDGHKRHGRFKEGKFSFVM
jgi:hypothetical protein